MSTPYRQFGESQKAILAAGQSATLLTTPQIAKGVSLGIPGVPAYKFIHVVTLGAANVTFNVQYEIGGSGPYTVDFLGQSQIAGVTSITCNSGTVELFFFT